MGQWMKRERNITPLDKDEVRQNWKLRAPAWNRWASQIERMAHRFNEPLVDAAGIGPGMHVLDLASGTGEPALTIARTVGEEGRVVATDMVEEMLAGTTRRAAEAGLGQLETRIADMEALPFDDASFDRVTCRFGIMFAPDPMRAMRETCRVLVPGGHTAWMVWGPLENTTLFGVIQREVRDFLGLAPDSDLAQFRFASPDMLADMMRGGGLADVAEQDLAFDAAPPAGSRFWEANVEMSFGANLAKLSDADRVALDARVEKAFAAFLVGDRYRIKAHVRIGTGVRA